MSLLKSLLRDFPLSENWEKPEIFQDELKFKDLRLHRVGFSSRNSFGRVITGAAAQAREPPVTRAFFELLERMSILDFEDSPQSQNAFPRSPEPSVWQYSKSNGVAAHTDRVQAMEGARLELIERDHILRSWFGQRRPVQISLDAAQIHDDLRDHYSFEAYLLGESQGAVFTVGVFGFPKVSGLSNVYGFGARADLTQAIQKAAQECLQALGFLLDETFPEEAPEFSPTPDFHQAWFARPASARLLRNWLNGKNPKIEGLDAFRMEQLQLKPVWVDMTPQHLISRIHVVKAWIPDLIPLYFGRSASLGLKTKADQEFHPVA